MSLKLRNGGETLSLLRSLKKANGGVEKSYEKLSSGKRITAAKDDAAGLSIGSKQNAQVRSLSQALRNLNDGMSLAQIAEGSMQVVSNQLVRLRELTIQAASDTVGENERKMLNKEFQHILEEIDRSSKTTKFNGVNLLDGGLKDFSIQIDTTKDASSKLKISNTNHVQSLDALGIRGMRISSKIAATKGIDTLDYAIKEVSAARAFWGSLQSRMQRAYNNNEIKSINLNASHSRITDADVALEASKVAKNKMVAKSSLKALGVSNTSKKQLFKLLK